MADERTYTGIQWSGDYTDDGEYFKLYITLNGVELPMLTVHVAELREKFDEAKTAGSDQQHSGTTQV